MVALILAAQIVTAAVCTTPKPGPEWVCVGDGWLPPGHPGIPPAPVPPPPPAGVINLSGGFQVGRTYRRDTTGTELYIAALATTKNGTAVFVAECLNEGAQDQCFFPGEGRFILANARPDGWTEVP